MRKAAKDTLEKYAMEQWLKDYEWLTVGRFDDRIPQFQISKELHASKHKTLALG